MNPCYLLLLGLRFTGFTGSPPAAVPLCRAGETNVYSFATTGGKLVSVCRGPQDKYLVYRYGTAAKTELQYPAVLDGTSWVKFTFNTYMRPSMGGTNEGMDINHLSFTNNRVRYTIYADTFDEATSNKLGIGVGLSPNKEVFIKGDWKSAVGSLIELRGHEKIKVGDEL